jgi:hypothetical protein
MLGIGKLGLMLGLGAAIFLQATASSAKITWDLKPAGTGSYDWSLLQHWTFNRTGAVGSYGGCNGDCNFHSLGVEGDGGNGDVTWGSAGAADECFEITTLAGAWTSNPDTVIEVEDPGAGYAWQRISDDFGGTLLSHARVWIQSDAHTLTFRLRVRAYSSAHNSDDFNFKMVRRDISKASCTSNQTTIPWAQITSTGVTLSAFH